MGQRRGRGIEEGETRPAIGQYTIELKATCMLCFSQSRTQRG